ncbi:MAG: hypothetical protein P9X24_16545 [Candidatus Hatepunaea meridiana]|nr:hypothetical protein [Candidatus Hatepunaea meridiana]
MATKRIKAKLKVAGQILAEFSGTHHLDEAEDFQQALELLDQAIYELETVKENLTLQIDGETSIFQTQQSFADIRVLLNGLEQSEGDDADYVVLDNTHIQFYQPLKQNETLKVEYTRV